jgi:alpha-tubulin suppressor-like RCC1 family protein
MVNARRATRTSRAIRQLPLALGLAVVISTWGTGTGLAVGDEVRSLGSYEHHGCALRTDRTVWCWGGNDYHQVGDGTTDARSTPVQVETASGFLTGLTRLSASGYHHTCALKRNGTVWCWGSNDSGQLGDGSASPTPFPVRVRVLATGKPLTDVTALAAGAAHSCALRSGGTVWCWGGGGSGQLGDGSFVPRLGAVQVRRGSGALRGVRSIGAGISHSCAVRRDASAWCWGENEAGQLGEGTTDDRAVAQRVKGAGGLALKGVRSVDGGGEHTCAAMIDGTARCWGGDQYGGLGNGLAGDSRFATKVRRGSGTLQNVTSVDVGYWHSCAATSRGQAWCWGAASSGELGIGPPPGASAQKAVRVRKNASRPLAGVMSIVAGDSTTCAVRKGRTAWCWGWDASGKLGDGGSDADQPYPRRVRFP